MKIKQIERNATLLIANDGEEYLFSYDKLVAGYDPTCISEEENGYWFVKRSYSGQTCRHIKSYLENLFISVKTTKVDQVDAEIAQEALM